MKPLLTLLVLSLSGCASSPQPAPPSWIRERWLKQEARKIQDAQKGVVWPGTVPRTEPAK